MINDTRLNAVRPVVERVARGFGLEIFDVQWRRESGGWMLRVVIDRPLRRDANGLVVAESFEEGIGIDECQRVSQDLSAVLDVEAVLDVPYTLEVSSPGLDRPLRSVDDYRRFTGRLAKVVVKEPINGQSHFEGRLTAVDGEEIVLLVGRSKQARIPLALVTRARLEVEF